MPNQDTNAATPQPSPEGAVSVTEREPEEVAGEIRFLSKRLVELAEELDPYKPATHDPGYVDDLRHAADILLSLSTIDSFFARSAFKAGWRTNADNSGVHTKEYTDGCEEVDWNEFLARGLRQYLEIVAQPGVEAALLPAPQDASPAQDGKSIDEWIREAIDKPDRGMEDVVAAAATYAGIDEALMLELVEAGVKATLPAQDAALQPIPSLPEGWVAVPREPTEAMLDAGVKAGVAASPEPWCPKTWAAMLAAAPSSQPGETL